MKHTTHYRITINYKDKIVTLTKPLPECPFFKDPHGYCEDEDHEFNCLVTYHTETHIKECFYRNYSDARTHYDYLRRMLYGKGFIFNNVFED